MSDFKTSNTSRIKIFLLEDDKNFVYATRKVFDRNWIDLVVCESISDYKFTDEVEWYMVDWQILWKYSFDIIKDIRKNTDKLIVLFSHHNDTEFVMKAIKNGSDMYFDKMDYNKYDLNLQIIKRLCKKLNYVHKKNRKVVR